MLLFLILFGCVVLLAGCDNAAQSTFKKNLQSIVSSYNTTVADAQQQLNDFHAKLNSIVSTGGNPVDVNYKISQLVEQYGTRLQADHATSDQLAARLESLPAFTGYSLGMSTVANGRQLISNSMNDVDNAMQGLGAGQPPADATALIGTASSALKQGIAYINEGSTDVFRPERVFLIMVIGIIIVLDLACAYWSGKSAKASGRRYWPAFGLGVLLGPVGLAITIFLNRRQTAGGAGAGPRLPASRLPTARRRGQSFLVRSDCPDPFRTEEKAGRKDNRDQVPSLRSRCHLAAFLQVLRQDARALTAWSTHLAVRGWLLANMRIDINIEQQCSNRVKY